MRYIIRIENLRAFHQAAFRWGEGFAAMHGGAVVPHDEVANAPCVRPDKFGTGRVLEQGVEQRVAFIGGHAEDVLGQVGAGVEGFATGFRVGPHERMVDALGWIL